MKSLLTIVAALLATAAFIGLRAAPPASKHWPTAPGPSADIVLVVDTTGSMAPALASAQASISRLIATVGSLYGDTSAVRLGLVAYRDQGEEYLTQRCPLAAPAAFTDCLAGLQASGGGDTPEAVYEALQVSINDLHWRDTSSYRGLFLIGDAPGHKDSVEQIYDLVSAGRAQGLIVHALQLGKHQITTQQWQQIAHLGGGHYRQLDLAHRPLGDLIASLVVDEPDAG